MTDLPQKAFAEASKLPESEQDAFARLLLEELADEQHWKRSFSASQERLRKLAKQAKDEFRKGDAKPLDDLL